MYRKKFIPPLLNKDHYNNSNVQNFQGLEKVKPDEDELQEGENGRMRLYKKLKTNHQWASKSNGLDNPKERRVVSNSSASCSRTTAQLLSTSNPVSKPTNASISQAHQALIRSSDTSVDQDSYYTVLYRKHSTKKHKTFDGDGILILSSSGHATLEETDGKEIGKSYVGRMVFVDGDIVSVGGKEVQIEGLLEKEQYLRDRVCLKRAHIPLRGLELDETKAKLQKKIETKCSDGNNASVIGGSGAGLRSFGSRPMKQFKIPLLSTTFLPKDKTSIAPIPRHDPNVTNALVMARPNPSSIPSGKRIVDVVVDPFIGQHLRPHQREGVKFLYESVMGIKSPGCHGAILADEMGLGKTLQTVALLWTLLKQSPIYEAQPVVKKALVVCPVTLIKNWKKEFRKWLGPERIGVFAVGDDERKKFNVNDFIAGKVWSVMLVGYERLQKICDELKNAEIDIVIADEGHRLKTEKNKAAQAIKALRAKRTVILSGTPLQNDLHEFFIMMEFVNPGLLDTYAVFRRTFENPIVKSRQPGATKKEIEIGEARGNELASITKTFILRRTAEILSHYLPPKLEYVVFCRPSSTQINLYKNILESPAFVTCLSNPQASLQLITILRKLCNSPVLLIPKDGEEDKLTSVLPNIKISTFRSIPAAASGKLRVLDRMLINLRQTTNEKVVVVSNYTSTLDLLQKLVIARGFSFLRLDGSTPSSKRQDLVDQFNHADARSAFAFLLSAKSGGTGLNLVGASRLVLYDCDWNPATDHQAMARIHRDGQKREVKVYRLITTGCIDEKIYQRQLTKQGLADSVMDQKSAAAAFTQAELRDIFALNDNTECQTHDLLGCGCGGKGILMINPNMPSMENTDAAAADDEGKDDDNEHSGSESDDSLPKFPGLMSASKVDMDKIQEDFKKTQMRMRGGKVNSRPNREELGSLYKYKHFRAAWPSSSGDVYQDFEPRALRVEKGRSTSSKYFEHSEDKHQGDMEEMNKKKGIEEEEGEETFIEDDILRKVVRETNNASASTGGRSAIDEARTTKVGTARGDAGWVTFVFEKFN